MVSFIEDIANVLERHGKCKDVPPKRAAKYVESCLRALDKVSGNEEKPAPKMVVKKQEGVTVKTTPLFGNIPFETPTETPE
jgi:hypothetical protein